MIDCPRPIPIFLMAAILLLPAQVRAQQSGAQAPVSDSIPNARAALATAEAAHPGNTPEIAEALHALITLIRDAGTADATTLVLAERELALEQSLAGPRSRAAMEALDVKADILNGLNRAADARVAAEQAFEIGQKEFPDSEETGGAANMLGGICARLGDYACAVRANTVSVDLARKISGSSSAELAAALNNRGAMKGRMGDFDGAIKDEEDALVISYRLEPGDLHIGVIENNLGSNYMRARNLPPAIEHLSKAVEMLGKLYGADSPRLMQTNGNLGELYTRTGQFELAWKAYEFALKNKYAQLDLQAATHGSFAQSLAQGGDSRRAIEEGLTSARMSREMFVLEARVLPERQALAYDASRPRGLDTPISLALKHPDLPVADIYQEVVRSRALVADEMARRQRNLNADNNPETARLLKELDQARADLLAAETSKSAKTADGAAVNSATARMESVERELAERSAELRADEQIYQVTTDDLRRNLPAHAVLVSYVAYQQRTIDRPDPASKATPSYAAFVVHKDSERVRVFDLGDAASLNELVAKARASADAEAGSGGLGAKRNERSYRAAALEMRKRVWDPLKAEIGSARLVLVVPDGNLNLIPFAGLPDGDGYLVEHGPVIHTLSSERDLLPADREKKKRGLLAVGSPAFDLAGNAAPKAPLRGEDGICEELDKMQFAPLPASAKEVSEIASSWRRWNATEPAHLVTGGDATAARFVEEAGQSRVLHVATHAFLLGKSCGDGNPLLQSGLVFAGGAHGAESSILTAQKVASIDLSGAEWAVLSACNTGNGETLDGEGVLGLERAFRVAGAHSVIMTLWPVDDEATREFMQELYLERLKLRASTADAVWNSAHKLLLARRAAGKSTHPWYWAGFVGSGSWE